MNALNNLKTAVKLLGGFIIICLLLAVVGAMGFVNMKNINDGLTTMYFDRLVPVGDLSLVEARIYGIRGDTYKYMFFPEVREATKGKIYDKVAEIDQLIDKYSNTSLLNSEVAGLEAFNTSWKNFQDALTEFLGFVDNDQEVEARATILDGGKLSDARYVVDSAIVNLRTINTDYAAKLNSDGDATFQTAWIMILAVALGAIALAMIIAFWMSSSITQPLRIMTNALEKIQNGIISNDTDEKTKAKLFARKDEFGKAICALAKTEEYMVSMTGVAEKLALNDLTVELSPKCDEDLLGNAFIKMVQGLRKAIGNVADSAASVSSAAAQLNSAANDAGQATSQIATTIQQVARGISQQSEFGQ